MDVMSVVGKVVTMVVAKAVQTAVMTVAHWAAMLVVLSDDVMVANCIH